jgi:acetyl/propionyl-CoA carboxylase alpha subunit
VEFVTPFVSVLIANRGEIAVRIARTCRALGVRSIAIYSDPDAASLHVRACDEAVSIGGQAPADSYLRGDLVIAAAKRSGAQALHPGYGFLSENPDFARACEEAGIVFIGPTHEAMRAVGDKIAAKEIAVRAGVPVLPGYAGPDQSAAGLLAAARRIGFPVLIKAAAGGGGRGMRLVESEDAFDAALRAARREARSAFGDDRVFLERYLRAPRHIEVQVLADSRGEVAALGERECSVQRRYQKIVEEAPSAAVDDALRSRLMAAAAAIARAVGYRNAGTVEFVLDEDGAYYFLEMNARLQVEHPVTELTTGLDLVAEQLWLAAGRPLSDAVRNCRTSGHAIEARIYAEDAARGFVPSTGTITCYREPAGVRVDSGVAAGSPVPEAYDAMIAKVIAHGPSREEARRRLVAALDEYVIGGIATGTGFVRFIVEHPEFAAARTRTDFLARTLPAHDVIPACLLGLGEDRAAAGKLAAMAAAVVSRVPSQPEASTPPWATFRRLGNWRHSVQPVEVRFAEVESPVQVGWDHAARTFVVRLQGRQARVRLCGEGIFEMQDDAVRLWGGAWRPAVGEVAVSLRGLVTTFSPAANGEATRQKDDPSRTVEPGSLAAPMSGRIAQVNVAPGQSVAAHDVLVVMEAMKMEHAIAAPYAGRVAQVCVQPGQTVRAGEPLAILSHE